MVLQSLFNGSVLSSACTPSTFQYPALQGAKFLTLETNFVSNYSSSIVNGYYPGHYDTEVVNANFCNVSLSYTRPGQNNTILTQVWLPTDWNGRMQGIGGGGYGAGVYDTVFQGMYASVGDGFATVSNDAGLTQPDGIVNVTNPAWALTSVGNVNLYSLQNFGSVSLNDGAVIAKSIIQNYYGQPTRFSYWVGCSGGGRQAMMLAQEYPDAYNGIIAGSPAINWAQFFVSDYYPSFITNQIGQNPPACEFDAIVAAAISACDGDDGIIDGVISSPELCTFDSRSVVGMTFNCSTTGLNQTISAAAATIAMAAWTGPKDTKNSSLWFGINKDSMLTTVNGVAGPNHFPSPEQWVKRFIYKDENADLSNMTTKDFTNVFHTSVQQYDSIIGTRDPNLDEFRDQGGKLISFHGMVCFCLSIYLSAISQSKLTSAVPDRPMVSSARMAP